MNEQTPTSATNSTPGHIRADGDGVRRFVLHPEDDDLFIRTGRQIIDACRLDISIELWLEELRSMQQAVREWGAARSGQVQACYISPRSTRIALFFVPRAGQFDFDLADALTDLNSDLVRRFNVGMIEIQQVPADEVDRFVASDRSRVIDEAA